MKRVFVGTAYAPALSLVLSIPRLGLPVYIMTGGISSMEVVDKMFKKLKASKHRHSVIGNDQIDLGTLPSRPAQPLHVRLLRRYTHGTQALNGSPICYQDHRRQGGPDFESCLDPGLLRSLFFFLVFITFLHDFKEVNHSCSTTFNA